LYNLTILFQDFGDGKPMGWSHFTAEGDVEFKALLSSFLRRLHMISMRVTTTVTSQTSSCMLEEFSSLMNSMTFFQSISAF